MAIRLLFFVFTFLLSSYLYASSGALSDSCPYGTKNEHSAYMIPGTDLMSKPDYICKSSSQVVHWSHGKAYLTTCVQSSNCADVPSDDTGDNGCFPSEANPVTGYCQGSNNKQCNDSSGASFFIGGGNCSDYCKGPGTHGRGKVSRCGPDNEPGDSLSDPGSSNGPDDPGGSDGGNGGGGNNGGSDNDDGNGGGSDSGGGDGGPGSGGSSGEDSDGSATQKDQDEQECGIGNINLGSGCQPLEDNCGYINGVYHCANPEPPSGCGTIQAPGELPITDCFEEEDGCGWFGEGLNAEYGCFDADDSTDCAGGILINGVCNKEDGEAPISCPAGFSLKNGTCVNNANDCPIGTSPGLGGQCTADDCPAGQYRRFGQCLNIPPTPNDPTPGNDGGGNDSGGNPGGQDSDAGGDDKTDFSSIINAINNQTKALRDNADQNTNELESSLDSDFQSLKDSNSQNSDKITDAIDKLSESIENSDDEEDGSDGDCDPESSDFLGCQSGASRGDKFDPSNFKDLSSMVSTKRQEYQDEINLAKDRFSDLFKLSDSAYSSPFWEKQVEIMGVSVDFGTTRFQDFFKYLPSIILFLAAVASARIMLGGSSE